MQNSDQVPVITDECLPQQAWPDSSAFAAKTGLIGTTLQLGISTQYLCVVFQVKGLTGKDLDRCITEVAVLKACRHINIVRYTCAFVSDGCLHIVMEYATGGIHSS